MKNKILALFVIGLAISAVWLIKKHFTEATKTTAVCSSSIKK
jgi:hypothetical protein